MPRSDRLATGLLAATPLFALLLFVPQGGWLFIALAPLTLWPTFSAAIRADRDGAAFRAGVLWAILLSVGVLAFSGLYPELAGSSIVRGEAYRSEMFGWIESGVGKEGDWHRFLPEHATHFGVFALLAALSGGYLGLALGAGLMAYMNFFVSRVIAASDAVFPAIAASWFPWSVSRVLAFIAFGVLLARPVLRRSAWPYERRHAAWFGLAAAGLVLDVLLKTFLASSFRERLFELTR